MAFSLFQLLSEGSIQYPIKSGCRQAAVGSFKSRPVSSVERPVMNGLGNLSGTNDVRVIEIGNRPAHLEDAIIGTRRQAETCHRAFQHHLAFRIDAAIFAD